MPILRLVVTAFLCLRSASPQTVATAQTPLRLWANHLHGWYMYFGDHPWRSQSRWGLHLEGQWRRHDVLPRAQQLLLRPALNYEVSRNLILTGGYAWVSTHRYGQFPVQVPFPEHRLWQQLLLKHAAGKVQLSHRYRLEQRFLGEPVARAEGTRHLERYRYENRFRYMLRALVPLKGKYALALFDEWMVNFGRNVASNVFDQNRAYVALAYQLPRSSRLELGYMHQLIQQRNGKVFENNHTFVVGIHSTFSLSKQN